MVSWVRGQQYLAGFLTSGEQVGGLQSKSQRAVGAERRQIEAQGRQRKQLCETCYRGLRAPREEEGRWWL